MALKLWLLAFLKYATVQDDEESSYNCEQWELLSSCQKAMQYLNLDLLFIELSFEIN